MSRLLRLLVVMTGLALLSLPVLPGTAEAQTLELRQVDPRLRQMIATQLRQRQVASETGITVRVNTSNCPSTCNTRVVGGMCYCAPDDEGNCGADEEETTLGGEPMCKTLPTNASVIGGGLRGPLQVQTMTGN